MSGARLYCNLWLRTLTSLGSARLACTALRNTPASASPAATLESVASGARTIPLSASTASANGAGLVLVLLANRGGRENVVELHHSPHGIVLAAQLPQSFFLQLDRRDGRLGGKDRLDQIDMVARLGPFLVRDHARDYRIGAAPVPKLHLLLAGNGRADHDHGADALGQRPASSSVTNHG